MIRLIKNIIATINAIYIYFVYSTSKITIKGNIDDLRSNDEQYVIGFWHGSSYSFFPLMKGIPLNIVTTINRRGDYIAKMCDKFGYHPIRVPDQTDGGNHILKIRRKINHINKGHIAIALDGPLGPNKEPKSFAMMVSLFTRRKLINVSLECKYKIVCKNRWDQFVFPLPFNHITITIHDPIVVQKKR